MRNEVKISVIVAIFNQEKYLKKLFENIKAQSFKEFEVILIDDGSTDSSAMICGEIVAEDKRFKYYHKPNGGVASARQMGLGLVKGRYHIHIDPDDMVEINYLEKLYNKAILTDSDIVICDYAEEYSDRIVYKNHKNIENLTIDELRVLIAGNKVWGICWNKLIRTELVKDVVEFEPGVNFQEDKLFIIRALRLAKKVAYVPEVLYHYNRNNASSAINTQSAKTELQAWKVKSLILTEEQNPEVRGRLVKELTLLESVVSIWLRDDVSRNQFVEITKPFRRSIIHKAISGNDKSIVRLMSILSCFDYFSLFKNIVKHLSK